MSVVEGIKSNSITVTLEMSRIWADHDHNNKTVTEEK